jgi:hypothetical protein
MSDGKRRARRSSRFAAALALLTVAGCAGDPEITRSTSAVQRIAPADLAAIGAVRDPAALAELGLEVQPPPAEAELVGAHYAIALAGVAVADQLTRDQLDGLLLDAQFEATEAAPLQAGPGREFLIVPLTEPESAEVVLGGDSAAVIVDGEARPLDRVPHELEVLVVNVPAGGDASLAITEAGETKSISLRTGDRGESGDRPGETLLAGSVQLEDGVVISGVTPAGHYDRLTIRVSLQPSSHLDEHGWAADGQMWLEVEFGLTLAGLRAEQARLELDLAESLAIVGSDGTGVPIPSGTVLEPTATPDGGLATIDWSGVFEVPDTLRSFEVSYATQATFTAADGQELAYTRHGVTGTGTIELTER